MIRLIWAAPATALGLLLAMLAAVGGRIRIVEGAIEAHGPWLAWVLGRCIPIHGVGALTLGHVVIGRDEFSLRSSRAHERIHVRQYEKWGPLFIPAYFAASLWAVFRGGHYYRDNLFEREAFAAERWPQQARDIPIGSLTREADKLHTRVPD